MPAPRSAMTIVTRSPSAASAGVTNGAGAAGSVLPAGLVARAPFTAWRAFTSMLTSAMRSRSASVVTGGRAGIEVEMHRAPRGRTPSPPPPIRGRGR